MYLHLGQGVVVPKADVIGIFDLDNTTGSIITRNFLSGAEKAGRVTSVTDELPRSFVVCGDLCPLPFGHTPSRDEGGGVFGTMRIYLSQLTSQTL